MQTEAGTSSETSHFTAVDFRWHQHGQEQYSVLIALACSMTSHLHSPDVTRIITILLEFFEMWRALRYQHKVMLTFLRSFAKLRKATIGFVKYVCLSARNNSAPTGRIITKFDI